MCFFLLNNYLELMVGHYINEGVEGGVEISNPEKNCHHHVGTRGARAAADGCHYVP